MQKTSLNLRLIVLIAFTLANAGCSDKSSSESEENESQDTGTATSSTGTPNSQKTLTTDTTNNLDLVGQNMLPGSLVIDSGTELRLQDDDNPCAGTEGFFDCQPNLLKFYMKLAQLMVGQTSEIVEGVSQGLLANVSVPTDGIEICDSLVHGEGIETVDYCLTSATKFAIKIASSTGPFIALDVDESIYKLWFDPAADPDATESQGSGQVEMTVDFTDASAFDVDLRILNMGCNTDDVRAPGAFVIKVDRKPQVWQGKAILYSPRWLYQDNDVTCADATNSDIAMTIYTDFVGNDTNTTASLFMMPVTVEDTAEIADWPASDFCSNFPDYCYSGYGFGDPNPVASYSNPFCVTGDSVTWGGACTDTNELISTPTYSPLSEFLAPAALPDLTLTFPEVGS